MSITFKRLCSLIIVLCLGINLLPVNALASEIQAEEIIIADASAENSDDVYVLEEVVENRTEYSKDYKLNNGLHIAAVYSDPVHFEKDGRWEEIDNTLKLSTARSGNVYTNTAGEWQVSFPQNISSSQPVTITKDGYTLSFRMAGELYISDDDVVVSEVPSVPDAENPETEDATYETEAPADTADETEPSASANFVPNEENIAAEGTEVFEESIDNESESIAATEVVEEPETTTETESIPETEGTSETETVIESESEEITGTVSELDAMEKLLAEESSFANVQMEPMWERAAEVVPIDLTEAKKAYEYEEIVPEKINSRLKYEDIYVNTDVIYDLNSNQVKESIVIGAYNANLRGYSYILDTGDMIPVLNENNEIELYDADRQEMIMIMPAPYVFDSADACSFDVDVLLQETDTGYLLTYSLPQEWLADSGRQWPVTLDPVVSSIASNSNAEDQTVYSSGISSNSAASIVNCGYDSSGGKAMRIYMKYNSLPQLKSADIVVSANMSMYAVNKYGSKSAVVEVHEVLESWSASSVKWSNQPEYKSTVEDYAICSGVATLTWDITDLVRSWYTGSNYGMVFKADSSVESGASHNYMCFYSANFASTHKPIMTIIYRNNNGLESYWDYTASSAGRAGTGYVNQYTGNLVWVKDILGFGGNRMPVSVNIVYNANDRQTNIFGLGYGWRTNYNQRVYQWSSNSNYYIWEDADGTKHYFENSSNSTYKDEDGLELTLKTNGSGTEKYTITDKYGNKSCFDTSGRLTKMVNNQATSSSILIEYSTSNNLYIKKITDGAGRVYQFTYDGPVLTRIGYYGFGTKELHYVTFTQTASQLTSISHLDGETCTYTYGSNNLLLSAQDIDGYKLTFAYNTMNAGLPNRVSKISESFGDALGGELNISYAHNQTTFTDVSGNVQIVQFNNWGNTVSVQDGEGRAQYAQYAIKDPADSTSDPTAKGNQLRLSSKMQNTVGNLLDNSSFESTTAWSVTANTISKAVVSDTAYHGSKSLRITRETAGNAAGVYTAFVAEANETYTFSAYVKTGTASAYLSMADGVNSVSSEVLPVNSDWTRLEVTYTADTAKTVALRLLTADAGTVYIDCCQLEKAPSASRYNLIQDGDFNLGTFWSSHSGRTSLQNTEGVPAHELSPKVYKMTGSPTAKNRIYQTVQVSGGAGDTFVLAGWAKGDSAPLKDSRQFGIIGTFNYTDGTTGEFVAQFNPDTDSSVNWQYSAEAMVAAKAYSSIKIELAYDYNVNTVYFDGIQLYEEEFGNSYTYDANGNVTSVKDVQAETTTYAYSNNNLTSVILPNDAELTYTYDNYHNVKTATTDSGSVYNFTYDTYGNNTKVSITSNGVTLSSSAAYTTDGNRLVSTTDAAGKTTTYDYDADTNVLKSVQYPEDTDATKTTYTYDDMCRMTSAAVTTNTGTALTASYTYSDDLLTKITTGSTTYNFTYGDFALRTAMKIGTRTLASYSYTDRTNYLSALDYGNGDKVQYTYDQQGRVTAQTYEDGDTVTYKYDNSGALAKMKDSATGITTTYYYDLTNRLLRYKELASGYSHIVGYEYDEINNLTALVETINGTKHKTTYAYDDDNRLTSVGNGSASEAYTYDAYSRVSKKVTKNGSTTVLTDTFTYRAPTSATTSSQVATLKSAASGYNVTYTYTYDDNGNILTVSDGTNTTSYVYDSQNQLLRENNQAGGFTHVWTYDNAGNITSRKEYAYTTGDLGDPTSEIVYEYGDSAWGDLLTNYNGNEISYDPIGNMTSDGTWTYNWEHGRELASMSDGTTTWTNTYNADGLRTKRTNGTTTYQYVYNGSSLSQMTVGSNTLYFAYDASGAPMAVTYNNTTYYYVTNVQGDVTAILDSTGTAVVQYTYDAWGNILSTTGDLATTLGTHNPLRYRGYVYDSETGLYYVSSRYYDPEIGRWINADDTAYLGADGTPLSYNLFAYCKNNPVMGYDPSGTFDWGSLAQGGGWLATGVAALVVGVSVLTCGVATPLMVGIALATAGAGALTVANGASEIGEAFTGYNVMRDGVFQGNATAYNAYAYSTAAVAQVGTAICGGWSAKNAPRIMAYNNIENYNYTNTISDAAHMSRPYANSVLMQKQVIKYGEMTKDSFGYVFSAMGTVNGKEKLWRLGVNTAKELVWHWGHGF